MATLHVSGDTQVMIRDGDRWVPLWVHEVGIPSDLLPKPKGYHEREQLARAVAAAAFKAIRKANIRRRSTPGGKHP